MIGPNEKLLLLEYFLFFCNSLVSPTSFFKKWGEMARVHVKDTHKLKKDVVEKYSEIIYIYSPNILNHNI